MRRLHDGSPGRIVILLWLQIKHVYSSFLLSSARRAGMRLLKSFVGTVWLKGLVQLSIGQVQLARTDS
jgi:hypothetical protein